MVDPTTQEVTAMEAAGICAGEYLENLGKSDLATMSRAEWMTMIEVVCSGFVEHLKQPVEA